MKTTIGISKEEVIQYYTQDKKGREILSLKTAKLIFTEQSFINFINSFRKDQLYKVLISADYARPASFLDRRSKLGTASYINEALVSPQRMSKTVIRFHLIALKSPEWILKMDDKISFNYFELYGHIEPVPLETLISWKKEIDASELLRNTNSSFFLNMNHFLKKIENNISSKNLSKGTKATTENQKEFTFYTLDKDKVKECMSLMGYSCEEYKITSFNYIKTY